MFTFAMNEKEIFEEAKKDCDWMTSKVTYAMPKIRRHLLKTNKYPFRHVVKGRSLRNNESIIVMDISCKTDLKNNLKAKMIQKLQKDNGVYAVSVDAIQFQDGTMGWSCSIFTPHCMKRYAQRIYEELGQRPPIGDDLLIDMIVNDSASQCSSRNPMKGREEYSKYECICCLEKCVLFGITSYNTPFDKVITWCTCLRYDQLNSGQDDRAYDTIKAFENVPDKTYIIRRGKGIDFNAINAKYVAKM